MLCYAMLCFVMLCYVMLCCRMLCCSWKSAECPTVCFSHSVLSSSSHSLFRSGITVLSYLSISTHSFLHFSPSIHSLYLLVISPFLSVSLCISFSILCSIPFSIPHSIPLYSAPLIARRPSLSLSIAVLRIQKWWRLRAPRRRARAGKAAIIIQRNWRMWRARRTYLIGEYICIGEIICICTVLFWWQRVCFLPLVMSVGCRSFLLAGKRDGH